MLEVKADGRYAGRFPGEKGRAIHSHPARSREATRDYPNCRLSFRWRSTGLIALDAVNGPTMTIEGRDEARHSERPPEARTSRSIR